MEPDAVKESVRPEPMLAQANLARMRGLWTEAADTCVRVLRADPGNADAHSLLGDIYRDQGEIDDAIQWYRMAADLRPNGPDVPKLRKLEAERERRAAQSGLLPASAAGAIESDSPGTTQLMGYSPKKWLNTLTIVSACFLAATLIVLATMRMNGADRGGSLSSTFRGSSHPLMPTAETGIPLPAINPNRPTLLPSGEQPREAPKVHETGTGLAPDKPTNGRSAPVLTAADQGRREAAPQRSVAQNREIPPAPVRAVEPLHSSLAVAPPTAPEASGPPEAGSRQPGADLAGPPPERLADDERAPVSGGDANRPAPLPGTGNPNTTGGPNSAER